MVKYYTRACNFYYGKHAYSLIKKKKALPLCGNKYISFDNLEIFTRYNKIIKSRFIHFKNLRKLKNKEQIKVKQDLKKIISKRKNFLFNLDFSQPNIMGILNITPDSFSDGGKFNRGAKSFKHIEKMIKDGASIIDIGGESTRPGSKTINQNIEWIRLKKVLKKFKKIYKQTPLSIDTRKSEIMLKSIKYGVDLINDVSGFNFDREALQKIRKYKISKVLHHMQGTPNTMQLNPKYQNVLLDIYDFFENSIKNKFKDKKIILDPGIGFGKTLKHNLTLISNISLFHSLGFPILIGTSRKRFINEISGLYDSHERIGGTLASVLFLLSQGVQMFRVHNVREVKQGILVFEKILNGK